MGLSKLKGKVSTHSEEDVWWRTFMVECVWYFSYNTVMFRLYRYNNVFARYRYIDSSFFMYLITYMQVIKYVSTSTKYIKNSVLIFLCLKKECVNLVTHFTIGCAVTQNPVQ